MNKYLIASLVDKQSCLQRRFIQPTDVSSLNTVRINGLNLYSYANNNPIGREKSSYIANVGMLSGLYTNTMLSIFKLQVVNSNAGSSNYWNPHSQILFNNAKLIDNNYVTLDEK